MKILKSFLAGIPIILLLLNSGFGQSVLYYHDFPDALNVTTYTTPPGTFDTHLSNSSWTSSINNILTAGYLRHSNNQVLPCWLKLTFDVASGYKFNLSSFSFSKIRSTSGAQNWEMTVNSISVGSGTVPGGGWTSTGTLTPTNTISDLTGTITININLTGAASNGWFAIDYFTLTGSVTEITAPVTIASFNSIVTERNVKIKWTTAEELNNSGFDIERAEVSSNKSEFSKIAFVNGKGTVNTPTNYNYEDKNLSTGKYKYRLKQFDFNGNYEYFNLQNEVEIGIPKKYDLSQNYPNPFNPTTKINFDLPQDAKVELRIFDMLGREMKTLINEQRAAGYYTVEFNASQFTSGMYFYRLVSGDYSMIKKMVILK